MQEKRILSQRFLDAALAEPPANSRNFPLPENSRELDQSPRRPAPAVAQTDSGRAWCPCARWRPSHSTPTPSLTVLPALENHKVCFRNKLSEKRM